MKPLNLTILLFFFTTTFSFSQVWHYQFDNMTITGTTNKTTDGNYLLFLNGKISEFSEYGEPVFNYTDPLLSVNSFPRQTYIHKEIDGYVVAFNSFHPMSGDFSVGKLGLDGNWIWQKYLDRPTNSLINETTPTCVTTPNDDLFMAGVDSAYLINPDDGQIIWRTFLTNDNFISSAMDGNQILSITSQGELFTLDNTGSTLSTNTFNIEPKKIINTDNNYIIVGADNGNATLMFFDKSNSTTNNLSFGNGTFYDIKQTWDDGFIIAGSDGQQAFLIKTDAQGAQEWQQFYGNGQAQSVEVSPYNGYVVLINESNTPRFLKTDGDGNTNTSAEKLIWNFRSINVSNIETIFNADGTMFWDYQQAQFNVPKDSSTSTIFAGGLWMGGFDDGGNLKMAAETYQHSSSKDYWAGHSGVDINMAPYWNKVWKIKGDELRDFKNDIADGNLSRPIPNDILTWPANGNPHFKGIMDSLIIVNRSLAEFIDVNNDGIYNAYDGDYPVIKGDEMLWWVFNDAAGIHTETTGDPIKATVIAKAYGYDCSGNADIYNTLFLEFDVINDAPQAIDDFYVGMWTDFDLGCHLDDYIGSDTISESFYVYNSAAIDGQGGCNSVPSYGNNPPVQSVSFLNQEMSSFMYYVNGGYPGLPITGDPAAAGQYYNYLTGRWRDGSPLYATSNGYQQNGNTTNYAFHGNPSNTNDWSMCNTNISGADLRAVSSTGSFRLEPGEMVSVQLAYTFHENIPLPCPDITTDVRTNITNVKSAVNSQTLDWIPNLGEDRTIDLNSTITLDPSYSGSSYQWSNNTAGSTLDITAPGVYNVTITDVNGCQKTDEVNIYAYTDVEEVQKIIDFKAFPNPTSDKINISFETTNQNSEITFNLVNVIGQTIKTQTVNANQNQLVFDVSELPTGIYFLNATSDIGTIETQKIVIER